MDECIEISTRIKSRLSTKTIRNEYVMYVILCILHDKKSDHIPIETGNESISVELSSKVRLTKELYVCVCGAHSNPHMNECVASN